MSASMNPLEKCESLLLDSLVADLELHEAGAGTWEIVLGRFVWSWEHLRPNCVCPRREFYIFLILAATNNQGNCLLHHKLHGLHPLR